MSYVAIMDEGRDVPRTAGPFEKKADAIAWMKREGWHPPSSADGDPPNVWGANGYLGYIARMEKP